MTWINGPRRLGCAFTQTEALARVACLAASQLPLAGLGTGPVVRALEESLIILGWVANWKPIETFLYDWWPLKRRRDL